MRKGKKKWLWLLLPLIFLFTPVGLELVIGVFASAKTFFSFWAYGQEVQVERHGDMTLKLRAVYRKKFYFPFLMKTNLAVAWSPDGSRLVVSRDMGGRLDIVERNGEILSEISGISGPNLEQSIGFVRGASQVLFTGEENRDFHFVSFDLWDAETGKRVRRINGPLEADARGLTANKASDFSISPDQRLVAMLGRDHNDLVIFRTDTWGVVQKITLSGNNPMSAPQFFPDSRRVAVSALFSQIIIFDALSGKELFRFKIPGTEDYVPTKSPATYPANSIVINPDQTLLFAGADLRFVPCPEMFCAKDGVQVFRLSDGARIATFNAAPVHGAGWDPKGRYIAFVDRNHLYLWQPVGRKQGYIKLDLPTDTYSMAISPDGQHIAVTLYDGYIIYDVSEG